VLIRHSPELKYVVKNLARTVTPNENLINVLSLTPQEKSAILRSFSSNKNPEDKIKMQWWA